VKTSEALFKTHFGSTISPFFNDHNPMYSQEFFSLINMETVEDEVCNLPLSLSSHTVKF